MTDTIVITTNSHPIKFPVADFVNTDDPNDDHILPATITLNGSSIPGRMTIAPSVVHLVIFDPTQPFGSAASIVYNKSIWNPKNNWEQDLWFPTNSDLYEYIHNQILAVGNPNDLLFLMATSGFDVGMVPTPSFATFLFGCGAGPQLQEWIKHVPGGSGTSPSQAWVSTPANYIFMGGTGMGFGQAFGEKFEVSQSGSLLTSTLTISIGDNIAPA